ncbi:hypothetical protein GUITHDRAFT_86169 [Guillardia theta CCMP2712]|uniref:Chorismate-utilising enzyme C-terminal domain-containing protein n=2 Tax=Guillardia theta TaxID=55529 RepID=L1JI10_GUITC|nr:hypothetical protein GUITHDRAFT_86169 [Guillardia theta CCMP2712]EKX48136.1 hypothetical protein GUITHDRAFT_86169 [Guillardia theta CCMP2712]|eukprot:XP_005835116.1 hypothetical protein GUITHDRAFT_86169 [Guillardia theta CCMP2712]
MPPLTPSAPAPSHGPGSVPKGAFPLMDCVERKGGEGAPEFVPDDSQVEYMKKIDACHEYIRAGESYELCLTTRLRSRSKINPYKFYGRQRRLNPAPYSAFLRLSEHLSVCSSSPERFLRISRDGWVESKPIKGTRRRGLCPEEDVEIARELQLCEKDRAENLMIVDLVRNDLGRICQTGSVHCPKLMSIESFTTVHQLVSTIRGQLLPQLDAFDCVRATFPMGSMTGAPKRRSLVLLDELESSARGIYSGSIGYFSLNGAADLSVCIRTGVFNKEGMKLGAGGAITILSKAEEEWEEMLLKTKALVQCARTFCAAK